MIASSGVASSSRAARASVRCDAQSSRRSMLAAPLLSLAAVALVSPGFAAADQLGKLNLPNQEVVDAESPFIQELLRKTAEKKDERKQERLDSYYKRNYKDYFDWEAGAARQARGISPETGAAIDAWLKKNSD